jgi:3-hydroxyacyl-CoA dehydrogenase
VIIGAGLMASQLALLLVWHARLPVVLIDLDEERTQRGVELVRGRLARLARRGVLTPDELAAMSELVSGTTDWGVLRSADLVIEAIYEDLDAKRATFAAAEKLVAPNALLVTNTSSLSITEIAEHLSHPDRVIGFHVFNPVEVVALLELIPGEKTGPDTVATALRLGENLERAVVFSADAPGFIVNRILTRMFDEIFRAIDAGHDPAEVDAVLAPIGLPMSPLRLLDFVGPAVQLHVSETMHRAFPDRFAVPEWLGRVVAAGQRQVLDGEGSVTSEAASLLPPRVEGDSARLLDSILDALADEAARLVREGVVGEAADIDVSLMLGANWPVETVARVHPRSPSLGA